jgi:hypothetical protein
MEMDILGIVLRSCGRRVDSVVILARDKCTDHLGLENQKTTERRQERRHLSNGDRTYPTTDLHEISPSSVQGNLLAKQVDRSQMLLGNPIVFLMSVYPNLFLHH